MSACPPYAPFFGFAGVASSVSITHPHVLPIVHLLPFLDDIQQCVSLGTPRVRITESTSLAVGAAYGTSKAGIGIAGLGQFKPELIMKVRHLPCTPLAIFFFCLLTMLLAAVPYTCCHVRNHCCVWSCGLRTDCRTS